MAENLTLNNFNRGWLGADPDQLDRFAGDLDVLVEDLTRIRTVLSDVASFLSPSADPATRRAAAELAEDGHDRHGTPPGAVTCAINDLRGLAIAARDHRKAEGAGCVTTVRCWSGGRMMPTTIRWQGRSHAEIYRDVHTSAPGTDHRLVDTLPWWQRCAADLGEVRARYETACGRLLPVVSGSGRDALVAALLPVTRGLTEAKALTSLAGTRRLVLNALNQELRATLSPPRSPIEFSSGFLDDGFGWLLAPDFVTEDVRRLNEEALARDRMRSYEQAIATDVLDGSFRVVPSAIGT